MKYQRLPDKGVLFQKVEITFFAWLPIKIGIEVRWLETVTVQYQYNFQTFRKYNDTIISGIWEPICFLN